MSTMRFHTNAGRIRLGTIASVLVLATGLPLAFIPPDHMAFTLLAMVCAAGVLVTVVILVGAFRDQVVADETGVTVTGVGRIPRDRIVGVSVLRELVVRRAVLPEGRSYHHEYSVWRVLLLVRPERDDPAVLDNAREALEDAINSQLREADTEDDEEARKAILEELGPILTNRRLLLLRDMQPQRPFAKMTALAELLGVPVFDGVNCSTTVPSGESRQGRTTRLLNLPLGAEPGTIDEADRKELAVIRDDENAIEVRGYGSLGILAFGSLLFAGMAGMFCLGPPEWVEIALPIAGILGVVGLALIGARLSGLDHRLIRIDTGGVHLVHSRSGQSIRTVPLDAVVAVSLGNRDVLGVYSASDVVTLRVPFNADGQAMCSVLARRLSWFRVKAGH